MIKYGFDCDTSGKAVCAFRRWQEKDVVAGYQLFVFGTEPPKYSVCPDSHQRSLEVAEAMIQECLENLAQGEGDKDLKFAAAKISDQLQQVNRRIYDLGVFLGEGIALGGAVMFLSGTACLACVFGGARMYFWDGGCLYPQGDVPPADGLVMDALGTRPVWRCKYWIGTLLPGQRFVCASDILPDMSKAAHIIAESSSPNGHENTIAMLLRKELEMRNIPPTAVLDACNAV